MSSEGLQLTTAIFAKPKVEKLQLLTGIANIVKSGATGDWASLPAEVLGTLSAIKLDDDDGMVGWKLISRSLTDALFTLISEANKAIHTEDIEVAPLEASLNGYLENADYFLDDKFFTAPRSFALINDIKPTLQEYIELCGFDAHEATNILGRLNSYFVHALKKEWLKNATYYARLNDALVTPFDEADNKEGEWDMYRNYLETEVQKPIFSTTFCLDQVYIPLRAYYTIKGDGAQGEACITNMHQREQKVRRVVVDIERCLMDWIDQGDKEDSVRIIKGGPGYGKSSLLKMLAARLAAKGKRVLFIPLHRFDIEGKLGDSINEFLKQESYLTHNPINDEDEKLIVLFDGLDELSMQGKALADVAQSFLREIERGTRFNSRTLRIQSIISGRDVIIQQNEKEFRNDGQVLSLLPYYLTDKEQRGFEDDQNLLECDQRNDWWQNYGKVNGENYTGIPEVLISEEVDKITAQPLLNFLVALSYERKKIDFSQVVLNEIYDDLLNAVYERSYSEGKQLEAISHMSQEHFDMMLEEIALSAWHGAGRTTTVRDIQNHFASNGLSGLLDEFVADAEKGVVSLLAAFYFRQAGQATDGTQTFEFTHKSFGEYLTAKKIIGQIITIHHQLEKNTKNIRRNEGWDYKKCLVEWINLFANKEPDVDLIKFIRNEFDLLYKRTPELLLPLQDTIVQLINMMLADGMPMEDITRLNTFKEANAYAINSEKALFVIHSLIASISDRVSEIDWPEITSFGDFISRTAGQRKGIDVFVLNHLDISFNILCFKDFYCANFERANLIRTDLMEANLRGVNLRGANLRGVHLWRANLEGADLSGTNLEGADLNGANLRGTELIEANMLGANLEYASFNNTNLEGANLEDIRNAPKYVKDYIESQEQS